MSESKPRDLTAEELAQVQTPAAVESQSAPLRIPPGIQVPIEQWNPGAEAAESSTPAAPTALPPSAVGGLPVGSRRKPR
jgi:hypothetical protein